MKNIATILPAAHHSASDWDFSDADWTLDPEMYISAPKSLKITNNGHKSVLCRYPTTRVLPEGQIITWLRQTAPGRAAGVSFRNQAALGTASFLDAYAILCTDEHSWSSYRINAGAPTNLGDWDIVTDLDTWYKYRFTWFIDLTEEEETALFLRLERWEADEWVNYGAWHDTVNQWAASEINRCGLKCYYANDRYDDTEILGPL